MNKGLPFPKQQPSPSWENRQAHTFEYDLLPMLKNVEQYEYNLVYANDWNFGGMCTFLLLGRKTPIFNCFTVKFRIGVRHLYFSKHFPTPTVVLGPLSVSFQFFKEKPAKVGVFAEFPNNE